MLDKKLKSAEEMPGDFGWPLLGKIVQLFDTEELFYWRHQKRYGSVFKTGILGKKYAFLIGPEANRIVLKDRADCFSSRLGWWFLEPIFGNGLLMQDGEQHQANRRLMYPAFHGRAIASYFNIINDEVQKYLQDWSDRNPIPVAEDFRKLTLIVASRLFLGTQTSDEVDKTCKWFTQLVAGKLAILRWDHPVTLYGRAKNARRFLIEYLRQTIHHRRRDNSAVGQDVLSLLMNAVDEKGNSLNEEQIIEETLLLLVAGHETTATVLTWLLFELAAYPEWVAKLREELDTVVGDAPLRVEHLKQLTQMTNVLKEVERLYPPLYGIPRGVVKDIEYAGYHIPAGWVVVISPMLTHRSPEIYSEPDRFDPNRFAPPREEDKKHPLALVGFGYGSHSCLGFEFAQMEMKIILATLLRQYDWTITPTYAEIAPVLQPSKNLEKLRSHCLPRV